MKKILIISATMMSLSIHSQEGRYAMHAFYFIDVSNPVAVVGALAVSYTHLTLPTSG